MLRPALLLALLAALAGGFVAVQRTGDPSERRARVAEACSEVEAGRIDRALELSRELPGPDAEGRIAAGCRCRALFERGRVDECARLIDGLLAEREARDWIPHPVLSSLVVRKRVDEERWAEADTLARAAARAHPHDPRVLDAELLARSRVEGEVSALASMESRLAGDPPAHALRLVLAIAHLGRADARSALRVLAEVPPPPGDPLALAWFEERSRAIAQTGDLRALDRHFEAWAASGADPIELRARYALRVSVAHLDDPGTDIVGLLRGALVEHEKLSDSRLRWALYRRLIGVLIAHDRIDEALAVYDEASGLVEFPNLSRADIERSGLARAASDGPGAGPRGVLSFRLTEEHPEPGELRISPDAGALSDDAYEAHSLAPGEVVSVERGLSIHPQRWVFRDDAGRPLASGTTWPAVGTPVEVKIAPGAPPEQRQREIRNPKRPGDGRRRVIAIVLDCSDWRLVQYLRARGELPLLDHLIGRHYSAVLESTPAFTAAAMEALVWPMRDQEVTFLGLVQRMGLELGGLASVGSNPLGFLSAVLPESQSVFQVIGAGDRVAANMLFSHGGIDAGRHAQVSGPDGREGALALERSHRPLTHEELGRFAGLAPLAKDEPRQLRRIETIAAELDTALQVEREGEIDLLLLRVEPLDLLTHAWFRDLLQEGQDDARSPLLETYRYIDWRLEALFAELDQDDWLIVMSDHGIRTPMEHETDALFVLAGHGVPHARAPGMPHLRGVPRLLADLMGVATDWPDAGLAPFGDVTSPRVDTAELSEERAEAGADES